MLLETNYNKLGAIKLFRIDDAVININNTKREKKNVRKNAKQTETEMWGMFISFTF